MADPPPNHRPQRLGARAEDEIGRDSLPADFGDTNRDDCKHALPDGDADESELGFGASSADLGALGVELSPWAPLLDMLDATEPEESPGDRPFAPVEGAEAAHALELRAESMLQYAARGALRTGQLDSTEVGDSDDNRDVVAGRDRAEIDGMLEEHTGHSLVNVADDVELNVGGPLRMHANLEDNVIMAGTMTDEFAGGTVISAVMSDDMAAGLGLRCTAPLDVWVHGLVGMEERPGTCVADGILFELAGTLYEREYGPGVHVAAVARQQGTVVTTMKTGFRPLMKVALGVRNLVPGGGGGGSASASPPAAPPAPGGGAGGEATGAVTLGAVEGGGALGRGVAGGDDADEIVSIARTVETASDAAEVEDLQHPASTADNLDELARIEVEVEVEGTGYRQVAEIYDQPVPLAPEQGAVEPSPGTGSAAQGSVYKEAPPLDLTEPGSEGYDFRRSYGGLRDQVEHYRADSNWRGNIATREYLQGIDAKATELFEELGGNPAAVTGDRRGYRTSDIYAAMEEMARQAELAGEMDRVADIRAAMAELEGFVQGQLVEVAARTDEFAGTALGSQRAAIDPDIDTEKLRSWLEDRRLATERTMLDPATRFEDMQGLSWTRDYYDQLIKTLDAGMNPLAESNEQIAFIQVTKVDHHYATWPVDHADEIAEAAAQGYVLVPPRPVAEDQLDLFLGLQDGLLQKLSDPELFRSADEMDGDTVAAAMHGPPGPGPGPGGPDSMRPLAGGVDEPDVHPVVGADAPPPPDRPAGEPSPGAGASSPGSAPREPPPLDRTEPGSEGYDFRRAYDSLVERNLYYRDDFSFRGNLFVREYLREVDAKALELFESIGGSADEIDIDSFGRRTLNTYATLETMAEEADAAGDVLLAAEIRATMAEIENFLHDTLAEVAGRTDEFAGTPVDPHIDVGKLRRWLEDQAQRAQEMQMAAETDEAGKHAAWEWGYYVLLGQTLDAGKDPLATANDQIAHLRVDQIDRYYAQFADEVAAAAEEGRQLDIPRHPIEDELDLYVRLQELLVETLSNPEFHRSAGEMGVDTFAPAVHGRIEAGLDFLGPDSLRPSAGGEIPPPLPAADFADSAGYIDEVRDRSFPRSALAASEETLERQAASLAGGDAAGAGRTPESGSGIPEPSHGTLRAPPDDARAPVIDERSGRWLVEPPSEHHVHPVPADGAPASAWGDDVSLQGADVSWESGLQASDDSGIGPAARDAGDSDTSNLFRAASEPEDVDLEAADEMRPSPTANGDGTSGSRTVGSIGPEGEDANPTGTVAGRDDLTTTPGRGDGTGAGPAGTTPPVTPGTPDPVSPGAARNAPGTWAMPAGTSAADADAGAAGTRSDLFGEPVSFEGRSLEGAPRFDDGKELARSLDAAEVPVEDLPRVEPDPAVPARKSILGNSDGMPVSDSYEDVHDTVIDRRLEQAEYYKRRFNGRLGNTDSVWADTMRSGERSRTAALREANARWSELASAERASSVSFSDDPRQLLYHVEHERTVRRKGSLVDLYRGADPPNTIDRAHAAHYVPRPGGWEPARETGFGRLSHGWNEFPFSHRERILNALQKGEALSPEQIGALESGLEGYRAAGGELSSSQYRAMVDMISDLGDEYRHARWHAHGEAEERLLELLEMLDYAARSV